ncbi:MAG: helix-turn-helix transcriptional regulator, partial [Clostridiales bacterium]|nr:helix-turn-helix transcriptional regulator [Clostridiales bacterium]
IYFELEKKMLLFDMIAIGNRFLSIRKRLGLTQAEVAEKAGLSGRTYADIERGTVNMRIETFLRICKVLDVTPDRVLTDDIPSFEARRKELMAALDRCSAKEQETALNLLSVYLGSLN